MAFRHLVQRPLLTLATRGHGQISREMGVIASIKEKMNERNKPVVSVLNLHGIDVLVKVLGVIS